MQRWGGRVSFALAALAGGIFLLLALMTTASVLGRWLFSKPIQGDFELVEIGVGVGLFLSLPYCQWRVSNVVVDFFTSRMPRPAERALTILHNVIYAAIAFLLAWRLFLGTLDMRRFGETSMLLSVPVWTGFAIDTFALSWLGLVILLTLTKERRPGDGS